MAKRMPKHSTKRFFKKVRQNAIFTIWLFSPQIRFSIQADKGYRLVGRSLANTGRCDAWETIAFVALSSIKMRSSLISTKGKNVMMMMSTLYYFFCRHWWWTTTNLSAFLKKLVKCRPWWNWMPPAMRSPTYRFKSVTSRVSKFSTWGGTTSKKYP